MAYDLGIGIFLKSPLLVSNGQQDFGTTNLGDQSNKSRLGKLPTIIGDFWEAWALFAPLLVQL